MDELTIRLRLDNLEQLYRAPDLDPFSSSDAALSGRSGVELLVLYAAPQWKDQKLRLVVQLPPDQIRSGLDDEIETAIGRVVTIKIADNTTQIQLMRRDGFRALVRGLIVLGVCLALSSLFYSQSLSFLPAFVNTLLGESFIVIGWIALWHPFEALAYDHIPFRRQNKLLSRLKQMAFDVEPWS